MKEKIKGGLSDNKTLSQIAEKHKIVILRPLKKQLEMGIKVEMEHTKDEKTAKEIAMDHLWEDPRYYTKLKKVETKESTVSDSSGSFETNSFNDVIKRETTYHPKNFKKYNKTEVTEVTDASSSGSYDVPFGDGGNSPLKLKGKKSIKNSRAVKDKKFPKWGGPDSVFIKVKEKCKKYPYCNQGDINAIELMEIKNEINEISKKYGIPQSEIEKIVLKEFNQIFIDMNISELNDIIESVASKEVKKTIISEQESKKYVVHHIKLNGEPVDTFESKEMAEKEALKYGDECTIEPQEYESYTDMLEKLDTMGQELEEKETMENTEQNSLNVDETLAESTKKKKILRLSESRMIDMIKKIVTESVPGIDVTKRAQSQSKKDNEENAREVETKIKKATTINGGDNPEFPNQNNKGKKIARKNTEDENEYVDDNRGGINLDLDYDHEPSKKFNDRVESSLKGGVKTGNSQDAANVVKSDLGDKLLKQTERKKKKEKEAPMYNKDKQPIKENKENSKNTILEEEIKKMKKIANYNEKTQ